MYVFSLLGMILDDVSSGCCDYEWRFEGECFICMPYNVEEVTKAVRLIVNESFDKVEEIHFKNGKISAFVCDEAMYDVADDIEKYESINDQSEMYTMMCREVVRLGAIYA